MAKKKRATKSSPQRGSPKTPAGVRVKPAKRADRDPPAASPTQGRNVHSYRHEVGANPHHGPVTIEVDISAGRGKRPPLPAFVAFTAEIAEEQWPDQFAFRLISLRSDAARVMITRVDRGLEELSWGAHLVVHVLVVD